MQRTPKTLVPQVANKAPVPSQPRVLDVRELAQVSGGRPRAGAWNGGQVQTLLPRFGGW